MSKTRRCATAGALALLTAAVAWGCGSSEAPEGNAAGTEDAAQAAAVPANRPPAVRSVVIEPSEPVAGELLTAVTDVVDPDGDPVRLTHTWIVGGSRYETGEENTLVLPENSKGALVELQVVANDGRLDGPDDEASHDRVWVGNRAPSIVDLLVEPEPEITVEDELAASVRAEDPDRDPVEIRYRWLVNDRAIDVTDKTLSSPHFRRGDRIQVEAVASDGNDESEPLRSEEIRVVNSPPRIVSVPEKIEGDGSFRYSVVVEDPDGDRRLRYKLLEGPKGMKLDWLSGMLVWKPTDDQEGTHPVTIEVDDLAGGKDTQTFELKISLQKPEPKAAEQPQQANADELEQAEEREELPAAPTP